ncbi:MAG: TIR domain-containing protein [Phycisphaerales bacterium]|nr:TIR domain-containing protein [Phycisphaerales bacterium]
MDRKAAIGSAINTHEILLRAHQWECANGEQAFRLACALAKQENPNEITPDEKALLEAIGDGRQSIDLIRPGDSKLRRLVSGCLKEAVGTIRAREAKRLGCPGFRKSIWEVVLDEVYDAAKRVSPSIYEPMDRGGVLDSYCDDMECGRPTGNPVLSDAIRLLDNQGFAEHLLAILWRECPEQARELSLPTAAVKPEPKPEAGAERLTLRRGSSGATQATSDMQQADEHDANPLYELLHAAEIEQTDEIIDAYAAHGPRELLADCTRMVECLAGFDTVFLMSPTSAAEQARGLNAEWLAGFQRTNELLCLAATGRGIELTAHKDVASAAYAYWTGLASAKETESTLREHFISASRELFNLKRALIIEVAEGLKPGESKKRFAVAFSFAGEKRNYVQQVDQVLCEKLGDQKVFYDRRFEYELAQPNLDTHLQDIYHKQSELLVVFLCSDYERKEWPRLEWRSIRDIIKNRRPEQVMLFRFDNAEIPGIFSTDGYVDATTHAPASAADLILKRLRHDRRQEPSGGR